MTTGKRDMDRLGLFSETKYVSINDPYKPSYKFGFNEAAYKGKQVIPGPVKDRSTGLQDGYFTKPFPRVFEKEAYTDPIGERRRERLKELKKNVTNKPFITFQGDKKPLGAGSTYGCFTTQTDHFSPKTHDKKPKEAEKPNVKTNPSKKGTGYGYPLISLDKYPEYKGDKYDSAHTLAKESYAAHKKATLSTAFKSGKYHKVYFDNNPFLTDKDGAVYKEKRSKSETEVKTLPFRPSQPPKTMGNMDGFINPFPGHKDDPYKPLTNYNPIKKIVNSSGKLFTPQQGPKTKPQESVINYNVAVKINQNSYKDALNHHTYNLKAVSAHN